MSALTRNSQSNKFLLGWLISSALISPPSNSTCDRTFSPKNDCAHPRSLHTLRHCAVYCYTLAGLYCTSPTTCDNKKVFQLRKEVTALVASFGVHTTVIKACSHRNRLGHRDMGCVGMSKAARNSGTDSYRRWRSAPWRTGVQGWALWKVWLSQRQTRSKACPASGSKCSGQSDG